MEQSSSITWQDARRTRSVVEKVIREHSKTFFFSTGFLPPDARQAIRSLYAFCRATDDLVDRSDATPEDVEDWRAQVSLPAAQQTNPILLMWTQMRERYAVDRRYENELIDGVGFDLVKNSYATWQDLARYCYHVASTVGLLSMPIIGLAPGATFEQAMPYAINLGIALQLTNILRDVGEDLQRGRIYLPLEDLQRFDLSVSDIHQRQVDERFRALMRFHIERAEMLYRSSLPGIRFLANSARLAVGAAAILYRAILDEIISLDFNVFNHRAHTTAWKKIAMMPAVMQEIRRIPDPHSPPAIPFAYA